MKPKNKVSRFDIEALKMIRRNVTKFIKISALKYDSRNIRVLEIGPEYGDVKKFFAKAKVEALDIMRSDKVDYVANIETNNSKIIKAGIFDIVICTEVLEHTKNPFAAINEIRRILKTDGVLLLSVPFNFRIHGPLPDCWRFTEYGLREILIEFKRIDIKTTPTKSRFLMPLHYTVIAIK